jgi:hypothetical protein
MSEDKNDVRRNDDVRGKELCQRKKIMSKEKDYTRKNG